MCYINTQIAIHCDDVEPLYCDHCGSETTLQDNGEDYHCDNYLECDYKFYIDEDGSRQPF